MIDFIKNFFVYLWDFVLKLITFLIGLGVKLVLYVLNFLPIPEALKNFVMIWPTDGWFFPLMRELGITDGLKLIIAGYILGWTIKAVRMALAFARPGM